MCIYGITCAKIGCDYLDFATMSVWEERVIWIAGQYIKVVPHAWEKASSDILRAIDGRGMIMRGRIWYKRSDDQLSKYPHTPKIDWEGDVNFNDVWKVQQYWLTWVVANDGTVYDPMGLFPEFEPKFASERTLDPFGAMVQALLDRMTKASWYYPFNLLLKFDCDAYCQRSLDKTEIKPFGDILMLPILDKILPASFSTTPSQDGSKLMAIRDIKKHEMVGAYPVDAIINHCSLIREYACPESTACRMRYPLKPNEIVALDKAKISVESDSIVDLIKRGTLIVPSSGILAVSIRSPDSGTFYNCHAAKTHETDYNATKIIIRTDETKTIHLIAYAERDISSGEEIVIQTDQNVKQAVERIRTSSDLDSAPRQEVYAFTDINKVLELAVL